MNQNNPGAGAFAGALAGAQTAGPEPVKDISTAQFMAEVIEASRTKPVLVDFWAPWCGPCRQLGPVLEKAVAATRGKVKLVKMNIDQYPDIPNQMGIQSIPAVVAFVDGRPRDAFLGNQPESEINRFLQKLTGAQGPSPIENALEEAAALTAQGATGAAADLYGAILQQEPGNAEALSGLGMLYLEMKDVARARSILASAPAEAREHPRLAALQTAIELADQASGLGSAEELRGRIEEDPGDFQARFDLALVLNAQRKKEAASEQLLEIVRRDRNWNDGAARTQLVQFFEAWGPTDPATVSARRRLSSLLFS